MPTEDKPATEVRFLVLGPVRVTVDGQDLDIGTDQERALLGLLLVESNRVVSTDRIAAALWSDEQPVAPRTVIDVYRIRVRRVLAATGTDTQLRSVPGGLRLVVDKSLVDVEVARSLLARASHEVRPVERMELLTEALALWRTPAVAGFDDDVVAPMVAPLRAQIQEALDDARAPRRGQDGAGPAAHHLLPDAVVAFVNGELSPSAHARAAAHVAGCAICTAAVEAASAVPGIDHRSSGTDTLVRAGTYAVSIYLADGAGHEAVEEAVARVMAMAGAPIVEREDPVLGSWFRRMRANPAAREAAMTAAHVAETRLVHERDAQVTATLLQHIGPVITALQQEKEAVVRLGAVLIVKVDDKLMVHQLTAVQQFRLDHQPHLVAPTDIIAALGLPTGTNGHQWSVGPAQFE